MLRRLTPWVFAFATSALACGAGTRAAESTHAPAYAGLDPTGLKLLVKHAELEGRADGSVLYKGKPLLVFSSTEARVPADDPKESSVLLFSVSGDEVRGSGKPGRFGPGNDSVTFDDGLSVAIRDGAPVVLMSGYRISTKLKFEALPERAKRAALLLCVFVLAMSANAGP